MESTLSPVDQCLDNEHFEEVDSDSDDEDEETLRQQELCKYRILDTEPELCYDDITTSISLMFNIPISLVTLVDTYSHRLFFKSRYGMDGCSERSLGDDPQKNLCIQCIQQDDDDVYEVQDTENPIRPCSVPDGIRYYAGAALVASSGLRLGTLCVLDRKPRKLTEQQKRGTYYITFSYIC
jgi:hypothetical protein